jgi:hypothetical protein
VNEPVILETAGLLVGFERLTDRWRHWIDLFPAPEPKRLPRWRFESLEGERCDAWPPSPPLQNLQIEQRPGGLHVALLLGLAGGSHWSLSVTVGPQEGTALFDVACRLRGPPRIVGSAYRISSGDAGSEQTSIAELAQKVVALESSDPACRTLLDATEQEFRFQPVPSSEGGPRTLRWRYRFSAV